MQSRDREKREILEISTRLQTEYGYTPNKLLALLSKKGVPATVFSTGISPLRALVTYLSSDMSLQDIAKAIGRNYRAVWGAKQEPFSFPKTEFLIPLNAFNERLSILESVVKHLKDTYNLRYSAIAKLLNKDQRTVWTVYSRAKKK